jgi:hypothetical protein
MVCSVFTSYEIIFERKKWSNPICNGRLACRAFKPSRKEKQAECPAWAHLIFRTGQKFSLAPGFSPVMPVEKRREAVETRILHWNGLDFSFCAVGWRADEHLGSLAR